MKTNYFTVHRIRILFSLTALALFPFIGNAQLNVDASNNVGVGTSSPTALLDVTGTTTTDTQVHLLNTNVTTGNVGLELRSKATGSLQYIDFEDLSTSNSSGGTPDYRNRIISSSASLQVVTNSVTALTILNGGNIGIGMTTPADKLNVTANIASQYAGFFTNSGNNANRFGLKVLCGENSQNTANTNYYFRAYDGGGTERGGLKVVNNVFSLYTLSDQRLKTNIINTQLNASDIIKHLRVVDYNWASDPSGIITHGFIAQECLQVYPDMVAHLSGDTLGISPDYLIPILVKAQQQQQKVVDSLMIVTTKQDSINKAQDSKIADLKNQIENCCSIGQSNRNSNNSGNGNNGNGNENTINDQSSSTTAILYQNSPNPFSQQTSIGYFIPTNAQIASIMIFDLNGKLMSTVPVSTYGKNDITINGNQLSPGMFVYSLIVDGKIIDTKKMILTQ